MNLWRDPRVLRDEWCPPSLLGREALLEELRATLPTPRHPHPRATVVLWGPRGAGTSALARWFARSAADMWTASSPRFPPLLLRADLSQLGSPTQVVNALFRQIDPSFDGRGASTEQLLLLLLRRLRSLHRPTVVSLDQVHPGGPGAPRVLLPLIDPDRFLPEGGVDLPPLLVVVAGTHDPLEGQVEQPERRCSGPVVVRQVPPLPPELLLGVLETRARLAFVEPASSEALFAMRELLLVRGWGLSVAGALLEESGRRAQARGVRRIEVEDVVPPKDVRTSLRQARRLDALLLEAMRSAGPAVYEGGVPLGELRRDVRARCLRDGQALPSPARLWRHMVELQRSGIIDRHVRVGGAGGTRTLLRLCRAPSVPAPASGAPGPVPLPAPTFGPTTHLHGATPGGPDVRFELVDAALEPSSGPRAGPSGPSPVERPHGPEGPGRPGGELRTARWPARAPPSTALRRAAPPSARKGAGPLLPPPAPAPEGILDGGPAGRPPR